mmetsp:Transcript_162008/g.519424  ORF Transcript_162008/g.519424 Transcript_162008/m.519424 type:complete len:580 (-) Transcript_162008:204-1943(-)
MPFAGSAACRLFSGAPRLFGGGGFQEEVHPEVCSCGAGHERQPALHEGVESAFETWEPDSSSTCGTCCRCGASMHRGAAGETAERSVQENLVLTPVKSLPKAGYAGVASMEEDVHSEKASSSTNDTTADGHSPVELWGIEEGRLGQLRSSSLLLEVESIEITEGDNDQAELAEFRLLVRHAVSGELITRVWVKPSDSVARLCDEVLRFLGEFGVCLRLVFHEDVLEARRTLAEAGVTATDNELGAVLMPLRCLTASLDGTVRLRHLHSGIQLMVELGARVWAASLAPGGSTLLMISTNGEGSLWCAETGVPLCTLRERIMSCGFSGDGLRFVGASDDFVARIWCAETGECLRSLEGHLDDVKAAAFSPDGALVVTASSDGTARIFEVETGKCLRTLSGHTDVVLAASFSPDGHSVLTASMDGTARLWRAATGELLHTLAGHSKAVDRASFAPGGAKVLTTAFDGTARLWDVQSRESLLTLRGEDGLVKCATLSPDGAKLLLATGSESPRLLSAETGECLLTLVGHSDWVRDASFSPDGMLLTTASFDGTARIWNTLTGECLQVLTGHSGAVVAADIGFC